MGTNEEKSPYWFKLRNNIRPLIRFSCMFCYFCGESTEMFLKLVIMRNVPCDPGSQDPSFCMSEKGNIGLK